MKKNSFLLILIVAMLVVSSTYSQLRRSPEVDKALQKLYDSGAFMGSVLIAKEGRVMYAKNIGMANMEAHVPITNNSKFELASLSKPFTALLVLQLVEKGVLDLNAKVSNYIPEFTRADSGAITIHHLLSHTSGLEDFVGLNCPFANWTYKEFMEGMQKTPVHFKPGSQFEYASSTYILLRFVIERVTGLSYEKNLKDRIFEPAGMKNSGVIEDQKILNERALGYLRTEVGWKNASPVANHKIFMGAASIYSTARDLLLFDNALYNNKLVSPETTKKMFSVVRAPYGYGWFIEDDNDKGKIVSHGGDIFGYTTLMQRRIKDKSLIVILGNMQSIDRGRIISLLNNLLF